MNILLRTFVAVLIFIVSIPVIQFLLGLLAGIVEAIFNLNFGNGGYISAIIGILISLLFVWLFWRSDFLRNKK